MRRGALDVFCARTRRAPAMASIVTGCRDGRSEEDSPWSSSAIVPPFSSASTTRSSVSCSFSIASRFSSACDEPNRASYRAASRKLESMQGTWTPFFRSPGPSISSTKSARRDSARILPRASSSRILSSSAAAPASSSSSSAPNVRSQLSGGTPDLRHRASSSGSNSSNRATTARILPPIVCFSTSVNGAPSSSASLSLLDMAPWAIFPALIVTSSGSTPSEYRRGAPVSFLARTRRASARASIVAGWMEGRRSSAAAAAGSASASVSTATSPSAPPWIAVGLTPEGVAGAVRGEALDLPAMVKAKGAHR
mmetsp:Transcript_18704/g.53969  ORF Transcript_18704/g.53969 Transcript_18704/m.53969 type:complete len:310 (-) Transcript_18704:143-1072(-)